ncbi:MAG TPA: sugar transferase [bacterium]|jgi:exopolysaccharide biosynthesis polyprenyl glycosylphosphotransferase
MLAEGRRRQLRALITAGTDAAAIAAAFTLAYYLRFYWEVLPAADAPPAEPYFAVIPPTIAVWLMLFAAYGLYRERRESWLDEALKAASAVSVGMMILLAGSFFYRPFSFSRLWILFAWAGSLVLVLVTRGILRVTYGALRAQGIDVRRVLIVGAGAEGRTLAETLSVHPDLGLRPVGFLDEAVTGTVGGLPVVGTPAQVLPAVRRLGIHRVIVAQPSTLRESSLQVAATCEEAGVPFAIVPDLYTLLATGADVEVVGRLPLLTLRANPLSGWGQRVKDAVDVVGAAVGLVVFSPLFAVIAVLIGLDTPGPVFYRHARIGKGGLPFSAWKFRTMIHDADRALAADPALQSRFEAAYKLVDDPRITRVGRWLRRTSLDELPQLFNVLKGEMSLVGPRPIVEEELRKYGPWERRLLRVRPGMTGLWQVLRHSEPDYGERVKLDMYYIDHWSVGLDLRILARTIGVVLSGRGAY